MLPYNINRDPSLEGYARWTLAGGGGRPSLSIIWSSAGPLTIVQGYLQPALKLRGTWIRFLSECYLQEGLLISLLQLQICVRWWRHHRAFQALKQTGWIFIWFFNRSFPAVRSMNERIRGIFTVHNSSCGKVMFLHMSVILFRGGVWVDIPRQTPPQTATAAGGTHPNEMHSCQFNRLHR